MNKRVWLLGIIFLLSLFSVSADLTISAPVTGAQWVGHDTGSQFIDVSQTFTTNSSTEILYGVEFYVTGGGSTPCTFDLLITNTTGAGVPIDSEVVGSGTIYVTNSAGRKYTELTQNATLQPTTKYAVSIIVPTACKVSNTYKYVASNESNPYPDGTGFYDDRDSGWAPATRDLYFFLNTTTSGGSPPAPSGDIVVNLHYPNDLQHTNNNTPFFEYNFTGNVATANCTVYRDALALGTNVSLANNTNAVLESTYSFTEGQEDNFYVQCTDGTDLFNSTNISIVFDFTNPLVSDSLDGTTKTQDFAPSITFSDTYLFAFNWTVYNSYGTPLYSIEITNLSSTSEPLYTWTGLINTTEWLDGTYYYNGTVSDDHTAKVIKDYGVNEKTDALEFDTGTAIVEVTAEDKNLLSMEAVKNVDRYTFEFEYDKVKKKRGYYLTSTHTIYDRSDLYGFPAFVTGEHWVDFNTDSILEYTLTQISDTSYYIEIEYTKDKDKEIFNSIGGLNIVNYSGYFLFNGDWLNQSFTAKETITNNTITEFYINSSTGKNYYTTNGTAYLLINETATIPVTITPYGYFNFTDIIDFSTASSPYNFEVYNRQLNVFVKDFFTNASLSDVNLSINTGDYSNSIYGDYNITLNLTSSITYNFTVDAVDYASNTTIDYNLTNSGDVSNLTVYLFQENSVYIRVYDEETGLLINYQDVSIEFVGDELSTSNTTSTGALVVPNLEIGDYRIRYSSDSPTNYPERLYFVTIDTDSTQTVDVYLLNGTSGLNITVNIIDEINKPVQNAYVKLLRYYIATNSYKTVEVGQTNINGETGMIAVYNDEFYKFIVEYNDVVYLTTTPFKITSTDLTFRINLLNIDPSTTLKLESGIANSLTFNNATNNFKFVFSDSNNQVLDACLTVYREKLSSSSFYNETCINSTAAEILVYVEPINGTTYKAVSQIVISDKNTVFDTLYHSFKTGKDLFGNVGVFLVILLVLVFSFIALWNPNVSMLMVGSILIFSWMFGLLNIGITSLMAIVGAAIIIVLQNKS